MPLVVLAKEVLPARPAQDRSVLDCWHADKRQVLKTRFVFLSTLTAVAATMLHYLVGP